MDPHAKEVVGIVSDFRDELADEAEVTDSDPTPLLHLVTFQPTNSEGAGVTVAVGEGQVVVQVGVAGRWELGTGEDDRPFLVGLLRAAAAGRVEEKSDLFGINCTVYFADGSEHSSRALRIRVGKRSIRRYKPWCLPATAD